MSGMEKFLIPHSAFLCLSSRHEITGASLLVHSRIGETTLSTPAILALEDGSIFKGTSIGAEGSSVAEVVFSTSMTAYQEMLTNPSNAQKLLTLTYPQIGNYGINATDDESEKIQAAGLIIRELSLVASNFRSEKTLAAFLQEQNIVAIAKVDTRRLTRILREKGNLKGCILAGAGAYSEQSQATAVAAAKASKAWAGQDLVSQVSTATAYQWTETNWSIETNNCGELAKAQYKVVVYDLGVKRTLLRALASKGCELTVVPANTPAKEVLAMKPNGVLLSNGPGDVAANTALIENIKELVAANIPVFGISLGMQALGLALGGKTAQLALSQLGANHPVQDLATQKVRITSQDQSFALVADSLPANVKVTHKSLFDGSVQGIELAGKPVFGVQGYSERYPSQNGMVELFDRFVELLAAAK